MTSDRPTPLDRIRHQVHTQQQADRPSESYVTVALGDLCALVTEIDMLRADQVQRELPTGEEATQMLLASMRSKGEKQSQEGPLYDRVRTVLAESDGFDPDKLQPDDYRQVSHRLVDLLSYDEDEERALREDLEDLLNQKEDLEAKLKKSEDLVRSMKVLGAQHYFEFGYDKPSINGSRYAQYCKVCDKEKKHPAHFFSGSTYLDSRAVEQAVEIIRERLTNYLKSQPLLGSATPQSLALILLGGLPGIPLAEESPQEDAEPHCACGAPKSNHPFKHPFTVAPPNDRPGDTR